MGITIVEVIAVMAVIALLAVAFIQPTIMRLNRTRSHAPRIDCMNNLKQIAICLRQWAIDHEDRWPPQVPVTNGGSMEFVALGTPVPFFVPMSNELCTPKALACPADTRQPAPDFIGLTDQNVSYFLSADATTATPNAIIGGDRNLVVAGQAVKAGLFTLKTNLSVSWARDLHNRCGNMLFADGHVETVSNNVNQLIQRQGLATNRLAVP